MSESKPESESQSVSLWASVESTSRNVETRLLDLQRTQRNTRNWLLLFAAIMVIQVALFIVAGYSRIRENFQPDHIQEAAIAAVEDLAPEISDELMAVTQRVLPIYQEKAIARIEASYPEFRNVMVAEFEALPDTISQEATVVLESSLNRTLHRLDGDLAETFPVLQQPEHRERFIRSFESASAELFEEKQKEMQSWLTAEMQRVSDAFFEFDPAPTPKEGEPTHEQQLIRTLLQIVDSWVIAEDIPGLRSDETEGGAQ